MKKKKCSCGLAATKEFYADPEAGSVCVCNNKKCEEAARKEWYNEHAGKYNQGKSYESYKYSSITTAVCIGLLSLGAIIHFIYTFFNNI